MLAFAATGDPLFSQGPRIAESTPGIDASGLLPSYEFQHRPKDFVRLDIGYTGKFLAAFFRIVVDVAAGARHPPADDVTAVLVTPFAPVVPRHVKVDDIGAAKRRQVARTGVVADEHGAERQQRVQIVKRQPSVEQLE